MSEPKELSPQQLEQLVDFAAQVAGVYSPYLSQSLYKKSRGTKYNATLDEVVEALEAQDDKLLREYAEFQKFFSSLYKKLIQQYTSYIKWNIIPTCINAMPNDYSTPEYAADKQRLWGFLDSFPYQKEFQSLLEQLFTQEIVYINIRKHRGKYIVQQLNPDYCMLIGQSEIGYLYAYDLNFFNQSGVDLDQYPPYFKTCLASPDQYVFKPYTSPSRFRGRYSQWVACPPSAGFYAIKLQNTTDLIPVFASALKDIVPVDDLKELQRNKDLISAYGIIAGEIATIDNAKTQRADSTKFNPRTLGSFLSKARQGLEDSLKIAALPLEKIQMLQYEDSNETMVATELDDSATTASLVGSVVYDSDKQNIQTIQLGQTVLESIAENTRPQFETIMNSIANNATKKFKWKFKFVGSKNWNVEKNRVDNIYRLLDKGVVLPPAYFASTIDVAPQDFERALEESKAMNWMQTLTQQAKNIYNQTTGDAGENEGRAIKDDSEIAETTEQAREARGIDSTQRDTYV